MVDYRSNFLARLDWLTIGLFIVLMIFGWVNILAATLPHDDLLQLFNMESRYSKQFVFILTALVLAILVLATDSKFWAFFAYPVYGVAIGLLIAVLIFGQEINGAKSWFVFGPVSIQPAEFGKFAAVLVIAKVVSGFSFSFKTPRHIVAVSILILLPALLVLQQNDTGSALVYLVLVIVLYREGMNEAFFIFGVAAIALFFLTLMIPVWILVLMLSLLGLALVLIRSRRWKYVFTGALLLSIITSALFITQDKLGWGLTINRIFLLAALVCFPVIFLFLYRKRLRHLYLISIIWFGSVGMVASVDFIFNEVLEDHQRTRISQTLGLDNDPLGAGYNLNQSKIAIGSGGFLGKGFLNGTQTRLDFVPEQSTDFIFCTVGEEWGFLGSSIVVILFAGFLIRIIILAERQRSKFSRIFGYGVFAIFFFHFMVNIGMTIGLVPVIGIPLPFFSYGGSSLWSFTVLLFVLLRLDTDRFEVVA